MQADFTKDIVETDGEWYVPSLNRTFVSADRAIEELGKKRPSISFESDSDRAEWAKMRNAA